MKLSVSRNLNYYNVYSQILLQFLVIRELNHPFHLHGYGLHVVGMGQHPLKIPMTVRLAQNMFKTKRLPVMPLNSYPPLKDTVSVPSRGYTVVRFRANNPGEITNH
jgi:FtsP/CotA-like multicopper oxidase with cupredoxin domain